MAKFSEESLLNFICDYVRILEEYEKEHDWMPSYVDSEYIFRYSDKAISLVDVSFILCVESGHVNRYITKSEKGNVAEFTGDGEVIAYLSCDGDLYRDLYEHEAYGAHPGIEEMLNKLRACADKYGMYWDWADGALKFYDVSEV